MPSALNKITQPFIYEITPGRGLRHSATTKEELLILDLFPIATGTK